MMTALVIVDSTPLDAQLMAQYREQAAASLVPFGGEFISKGELQVLHGETDFSHKAVLRFDSPELAKAWYYSEAYQALTELRNKAMHSQFHLV
ncbi:DUF1330 domain-containing protein [Motilimonas eburnea]|uniref:DUF1330 domain-containing protein n=1 Tax=Motilimonas eburnea TaxID=1737488 RepID=UPI001E3AFB55|nr:DUF1330 domain-containing protein [Motilimonas eburnea]MCE2571099.1 DUF1330 domain-containing protein [Motilimonas eburnea]